MCNIKNNGYGREPPTIYNLDNKNYKLKTFKNEKNINNYFVIYDTSVIWTVDSFDPINKIL